MADKFVDGTKTGGANSGESFVNAYEGAAGLQAGIDTLAAGDDVHVVNTVTLNDGTRTGAGEDGAPIQFDNIVGSFNATSQFIGYGDYNGGAPIEDGTPIIIDGNDVTTPTLFNFGVGAHHIHFRNFDFTGADGSGWEADANNAEYIYVTRCRWYANAGHGINGLDTGFRMRYLQLELCEAFDNTNGGSGIELYGWSHIGACSARNNAGFGILTGEVSSIIDCPCYKNTSSNIKAQGTASSIRGCTSEAGSSFGIDAGYFGVYAGNRATNGSNSFRSIRGSILLYNYVDSITAPSQNANFTEDEAVESNLFTGEEGYEDKANDKLNIRLGAAGYRTVIRVDSNNSITQNMGLTQVPIVYPGGE